MSEIDIQNAKQIRDPMDVLITMSLANADISMTYSGYSMAKVADGELDETSWPMRKLADLQGDGFPLDGSCVLYNASTTPSQANGKLGVRSNVGETVTVTATGNDTMASIGASVTGAESVTINGTTTPIPGTNVVIPLLASSATMVFNPASETRRIEISTILPEADFKITNENLIRATVSLRSDLSIIDPTLPESEINIEAYFDEDVSEAVAAIPEDTPIKYQAGYPGDMSPERKFYVTGQVTWADNVLNIQGVDAVHFLDVPQENLCFWSSTPYDQLTTPSDILRLLTGLFQANGVSFAPRLWQYRRKQISPDAVDIPVCVFPRGVTIREMLAFLMQFFHIDNIPPTCLWYQDPPNETALWPVYVDAGAPSFTQFRPDPKWEICEEDCGEIKKRVERKISRLEVNYSSAQGTKADLSFSEMICGSVDWYKTGEAYPQFNSLVSRFMIGLPTREIPGQSTYFSTLPILPVNSNGDPATPDGRGVYASFYSARSETISRSWVGETLIDEDTPQILRTSPSGNLIYTQVVPHNAQFSADNRYKWRSQSAAWSGLVSAGIISSDTNSAQLNIYGCPVSVVNDPITVTNPIQGDGETATITPILYGWMGTRDAQNDTVIECYPKRAFESIFDRSNITGSFTWKGDPRMQPRDVVEWERLDGTTTTITLENITLTHKGGGTMAEITYREGVV